MDGPNFDLPNFDLKEEIRDYWSKRSETFDLAFGHRIAPGPEADAWQKPIRDALGPELKRVLELACGTGEVTRRALERAALRPSARAPASVNERCIYRCVLAGCPQPSR